MTKVTDKKYIFSDLLCFFCSTLPPGESIAEVKEGGEGGGGSSPPPGGSNVLTIVTVVGSILLVLNLGLLYCYIKRRAAKHLFGKQRPNASVSTHVVLFVSEGPLPLLDEVLAQKEDIPLIVIVSVSVAGVLLLLLNIVLVLCFVRRRASLSGDKSDGRVARMCGLTR